jgi:probable HAF family extracellular repeat protein
VKRIYSSLLSAVLLAALSHAATAQTYVLTDLGALSGSPSNATDISPSGIVTGGFGTGGTSCALWKPAGGGMVFQNLGKPSSADYMPGFGVNDLGQVAATGGHWSTGISGQIGWEGGFVWSGKWQGLTGKTTQSEALAVNATGTVVGLVATSNGHPAAMWQRGRQYVLNGVPSSPAAASAALGINDSGRIVGYYGGGGAPFLWVPSKPNGTVGAVAPFPLSSGRALGINTYSHVVGDMSTTPADPANDRRQAYFWDGVSPSVTLIGTAWPDPFNPGAYLGSSTARRVNASGQVVGNMTAEDGTTVHGFVWDVGNGLRDLNDLNIQGGLPAGWVLTCQNTRALLAVDMPLISINDSGKICGTAQVTVGGVTQNRAFLLTPVAGP